MFPKEILKHAYSRIDETKYSVFKNNYEHFTLWYKTGNDEVAQVKLIAIYIIIATGVSLRSVAESKNVIDCYLAG